MKFNRLFVAAIAASAFLLESCTTTASDDEFDWYGMSKEEYESQPTDVKELMDTYNMLLAFYLHADTELMRFEDYVWQGPSHGFGDSYEFPDVSYMFSTINDNFTNYFSPSIAARIMNSLIYSEKTVGLGADFTEIPRNDCTGIAFCNDSTILIFKHVYPDGPADKAGIQKGDTVYIIEGRVPRNLTQFENIVNAFDLGESIRVTTLRGEDTLAFSVTLEEYLTPTVFVDEIDSIPVITITEFTDTTNLVTGTYGEFLEALKQTEGAPATIIDLRDNPGGSTEQCINMATELVLENDTILSIVSRHPDSLFEYIEVDTTTYVAEKDGIGAGRYLVMLANSNSASCAELMLMGVTSNTKSPVVGETTYGKGIGQTYMETYAGGVAGVTSMKLFDKDKKSYHRYGIAPDYEISDSEKALKKAVALAKERTETRNKGYGTVDTGHFLLSKKQGGKTFDRGAFKIIRR